MPDSPSRRISPPAAFLALAALIALFAGCGSSQAAPPQEIPLARVPEEERWDISGFQGEEGGGAIPEWVERYLRGGSALVEEMPEFADRYVFASEEEGVSFSALERRREDFMKREKFSWLVAFRVNRRLTALGGTSPSREFSRFHAAAVRAVADTSLPGFRQERDFWLIKRYPPETDEAEEREQFLFLLLISTDREELRNSLDRIIWQPPESGPERDPLLIRRLRAAFYEGF